MENLPFRKVLPWIVVIIGVILVTFFYQRGFGSKVGEGITLYRTVYNGVPTGQGYVYIPFVHDSSFSERVQVGIDLNGDGVIAPYETASGTQEEWVIRDRIVDAKAGDANRLTWKIVDGGIEKTVKSGVVVLTKGDATDKAWTEKFANEIERSSFVVSSVVTENRDARLQLDGKGERATGIPMPQLTAVAYAAGAAPVVPYADDYARIDEAPDQDQLWNECAPTAISNSFRWLAKKYKLEDKMPKGNTNDLIDEIKGDVAWDDGVMHASMIAGKQTFIDRHGLPLEAHQIGTEDDGNIIAKIRAEIRKGQAVEVWLAFYNASGTPAGAHLVTVVGAGSVEGKEMIAFHDPDTSSEDGKPSRDVYQVTAGNFMADYDTGIQTYIRYAYAQSPIPSVIDGTWADPGKTGGVLVPGTSLTPPESDITLSRSQFGFFSTAIDHPGDHYVGDTFTVRAGVRGTGKTRDITYWAADDVRHTWTMGAGSPWTIRGEFEGSGNVTPAKVTDAPPLTSVSIDRFTTERSFTCAKPGLATVSYKATIGWPGTGEAPPEVLAKHHGAEFNSRSDEMRVESPAFRCIAKPEVKKDDSHTAGGGNFCEGIAEDPNGKEVPVLKSGGKCYPTFQFHNAGADKCDASHWHANAGTAVSLDGSTWVDPSGCGFGKVSEVAAGSVKLSPDQAAKFLGGR